MKKIAVYVRNKNINPSGYYRLFQFMKKIDKHKIKYRELVDDKTYLNYHFKHRIWDKIKYIASIWIKSLYFLVMDTMFYKPEIVIINREVLPRKTFFPQSFVLKRLLIKAYVIWDFDDAILTSGELGNKEWKMLQKYSNKIVLLNSYLKDMIDVEYKNKVIMLPTTDGDYVIGDNDAYIRRELYNTEIRLLWIATSSNINSLMSVIEEIDEAAKEIRKLYNKKLVLTCVCNKTICARVNYVEIENVIWSRESALDEMRKAHIGIMPLLDTAFTKGKGGFKLIQYMSAGIPVIASNVGFNKEIVDSKFGFLVDKDEWIKIIIEMSNSFSRWETMALMSRIEFDEKYSYEKHLLLWENLLDENR